MFKNVTRNLLIIVLVSVSGAFGATVIDDPMQLVGNGSVQFVWMNFGDNLMERIDCVDYMVDKGGGQYYIFLCEFVNGDPNQGVSFGAYVSTDNDNSDNYPGYEGWCQGLANRDKFFEGDSPDYILIIYDDDGGQFALAGPGGISFDGNIVAWESGARFAPSSGDIEYGGVIGGLLDIVFEEPSIDIIWLDSIFLIPPPVLREGPFDLDDFAVFAYYWLDVCECSNAYCEGYDFSGDGFLNNLDFVSISREWDPGVPESIGLATDEVSVKGLSVSGVSFSGKDSGIIKNISFSGKK